MIRYLQSLAKHFGRRFYAVLALMFAVGLCEGVGLLTLIPMLQLAGISLSETKAASSSHLQGIFETIHIKPNLPFVLFLYVGALAIIGWLTRQKEIQQADIQHDFTRMLRNKSYAAIVRANWLFISQNNLVDHTHLLTSEVPRAGLIANYVFSIINTCILLTLFTLGAFWMSPLMTLCVVGTFALLSLFLKRYYERSRIAGQRAFATLRDLYQATVEQLSGIKTVKSFGIEAQQQERFEAISQSIQTQHVLAVRISSQTKYLGTLCTAVFFGLVYYISIAYLHTNTANLLLLTFIFVRLLPKLLELQQSYHQIVNLMPSYNSLETSWAKYNAAQEFALLPSAVAKHAPDLGHVKLDDISFSYDSKHWVLDSISLHLKVNTVTAIVGQSGCGKSTLADILAGLLIPAKGTLSVNNLAITVDKRHAWRQQVGYVTQETFLFNDTVRNNLSWGNEAIHDDAIWHTLVMVAADDFVRRLPLGLHTTIGDRGIQLSGGQRQRLAMARILLRRPSLLILDEAMSALDPFNESRIHQGLIHLRQQWPITIVMISHRPESIRYADQIISLEKSPTTVNSLAPCPPVM